MKHPFSGAFIGAISFPFLLQNFAIDLVDRQRFNLVIGGVFLLIVFFSPDGLLGLVAKISLALVGRFHHACSWKSPLMIGIYINQFGNSTLWPVGPGRFSPAIGPFST
jgi:hypothetical protein